jgi:type IV pilus assembly protein PilN
MKITVNLATRPFVELQPYFKRLRIVMVALLVLGLGLIIGTHFLQKNLDVAQAQIDQLKRQTATARLEKSTNERRMRQPENAAVLDRAHFLNTLFLRKSFSWTAVMMDLETVLPGGVQVTSIEPSIAADGTVIIRLRVAGDRDRAIQLVRNLERSKRFLQPRLTGEATQAKEAGNNGFAAAPANGAPAGVQFEILADYNPLPEGEAYPKQRAVSDASASKPVMGARKTSDGIVLKPYAGGAR